MLSQQTKEILKQHITTKRKILSQLRKCNLTMVNLASGRFDMSKELTLSVIVTLARLVQSEIKLTKILEKENEQ